MWGIITMIIIALIIYACYIEAKPKRNTDNDIFSSIQDERKDIDWWTIGMLADMHNKINDKKNKEK